MTGPGEVVISLRLPRDRDVAAACRESAEATAARWGTDLGLAEPPVVELRTGSPAGVPEVEVRGVGLPLSARRVEQVLAVVTGRYDSPGAGETALARLGSLWQDQPGRRPSIAANWLDAALRTSDQELRPLLRAPDPDQDPDSRQATPVIELPEAYLRIVTSHPREELNALTTQFTTAIYQQYGVVIPGLGLAFGAPGLFRFSFDGLRTPAYLLPESGTLIVQEHPDLVPGVRPAGSVVDPVTGARWTLLDADDAAGLDPDKVLGPIGFVLQALQAECIVRLARWVPVTPFAYRTGLGQEPELDDRVSSFLPELTSRLVAERASGQFAGLLVECILRVLARGSQSLDEMEDEARRRLGDALLGELHLVCVPVLVDLDIDALPSQPRQEEDGLRKALLARVPELLRETSPVVLRVPAAARSAAAAALRPLADVVLVVAREEFEPTPALRARWAAMSSQSAGGGDA